jgi:hypothetical protein
MMRCIKSAVVEYCRQILTVADSLRAEFYTRHSSLLQQLEVTNNQLDLPRWGDNRLKIRVALGMKPLAMSL